MVLLQRASIEEALKSGDNLKRKAGEIAADITNGTYDISGFVEQLGFALTSSEVDIRVKGTELLSGVLGQLPKELLSCVQLEFLTTFYADRLKDHHNVIPAVIDGIDALLSMKHFPPPNVSKLLRSFFQHTTCQSQLQSDRAKLYKIFRYLGEHYADELKAMSGDFIYGLINSVDGERDPRNLDLIFSFMPKFIEIFPLLHLSEEMFETMACYFPIDFNPSKSDPNTITRDILAKKLIDCLVASPDFVEWTVSLGLEKLDSDLVVAKMDSLELLCQAAIKFSPKDMAPHFEQIWNSLKREIFPGGDNDEVISAGLRCLGAILEQAVEVSEISHNYQTIVLGNILSHLTEVNQRLFNPATGIALVCVSADPLFASNKVLNSFLLKLKDAQDNELYIKIYNIVSRIFKVISVRHNSKLVQISGPICDDLLTHVIATLRNSLNESTQTEQLDLQRSALIVLNESVPLISETQRVLVYQVLVNLLTHDFVDLDVSHLLEQLGALHPIELHSNCIDKCTCHLSSLAVFVKRKIYRNLLPLVKQLAFTERILGLILTNIFKKEATLEERLLALEALNLLLRSEENHFIEELQNNNCLIDKLIKLGQQQQQDWQQYNQQVGIDEPPVGFFVLLEHLATALGLIMQHLGISEQYIIVTEYLPELNLQLVTHLFIAKGLLGYLHKDISLTDHFESLIGSLSKLSLESSDQKLRLLSNHLLCSLINKNTDDTGNYQHLTDIIVKLKEAINGGNTKAVETLAWVTKALIIRGYEQTGDIVETLANLLADPSTSIAACTAFEIISTEYTELHLPVVKFLYKQKLFHMVLTAIGNNWVTSEPHLNALMYLLQGTPYAVLRINVEKVVTIICSIGPILFKGLESSVVQAVNISLQICEHFVHQQHDYFRSHLNHIIPSCLRLSMHTTMQVRISALQLLHDMTKYPTFVLLPYKIDVVLELASALNDKKRMVRNVAVKTRNAWFLIDALDNDETT